MLNGYASIGPVYFILLLFLVRLIYLLINKYTKSDVKKTTCIVICLSLIGYFLSRNGYWLPWSLDISLYSLIFYHIGYYLNKYKILDYITRNYIFYFLLSILWAYMIYAYKVEIATRLYSTEGDYLFIILGTVSALCILLMMCRYLSDVLPHFINNILSIIGRNTVYILIIHTLFNSYIFSFVCIRFDALYIYSLIGSIIIQLLLGCISGYIIENIRKNKVKNTKTSLN